jgi:hypothetical protein
MRGTPGTGETGGAPPSSRRGPCSSASGTPQAPATLRPTGHQASHRRTTGAAVEPGRSLPEVRKLRQFSGPATGLAGARGDDLTQPVRHAGRVHAQREGTPGQRFPGTGKGRPQHRWRSRPAQSPGLPAFGSDGVSPVSPRSRRRLARSPPGDPSLTLKSPALPASLLRQNNQRWQAAQGMANRMGRDAGQRPVAGRAAQQPGPVKRDAPIRPGAFDLPTGHRRCAVTCAKGRLHRP